jgi:hypothetical protein
MRFYVLRGHEVVATDSMVDAATLMGDAEGRTVAKTHLSSNISKEECEVSTVFLSIDHNWTDQGPPVVFETLVFGGPMDDWMRRYTTWDEAALGHAETVELVRRALRGEKPDETEEMVLKYERRTWHDHVLNDEDV